MHISMYMYNTCDISLHNHSLARPVLNKLATNNFRHTDDTALAYKQTWTTVFTFAISFIFTLFGATLILPCDLVRHLPGPSFSCPAIWSFSFHVRHFHPLFFFSPNVSGPAFSVAPVLVDDRVLSCTMCIFQRGEPHPSEYCYHLSIMLSLFA